MNVQYSLNMGDHAQQVWNSWICFPPNMGARFLTFQASLLSLQKLTWISRNAFPREAGSIILIPEADGQCLMQMLFGALWATNIMLFEPAQCRLKWPPWSAQRVFVETCEKKTLKITIHPVGASENRKIKLLAQTRRQSVRRREIYVLRVSPTFNIFVDDFVAKFLRQKLV